MHIFLSFFDGRRFTRVPAPKGGDNKNWSVRMTDLAEAVPAVEIDFYKESIALQAKFQNLHNVKPNEKWIHERALALADHFEALADDETYARFWMRPNVAQAIETGDVRLMDHWLRLALWKVKACRSKVIESEVDKCQSRG